ncbi:acyl-CoA synthetase [Oceanicella actignis]|uniref:acyl-CoA synthetase n=1 Tax=Oceanicella actignis TaxID=1189325 RepID=UPI0011E815F8|nr:acyl-CoA synthetase [Oceanicella actignis]TYO91350.1 fatty-acyl-CoA synthase [Oceanicella actignis]
MPFAPMRQVRSLADVEAIEAIPLEQAIKPASTYEILADSARAFGDKTALTFLRTGDPADAPIRWSYAELFANVTRTANALHALGIGPNDAVAFLLPGCLEAHLALWGAEAAGVTQPLNPLLTDDKLADLMRAAGARALIAWGDEAEAGYWSKARRLFEAVEGLAHLIRVDPGPALGGDPTPTPEGALDLRALIADQPADRLVSGRVIRPEDTAAYFHTGGTTGAPKLARHTHGGQVFTAWACVQMQGVTERDVTINGYPLFHVAGVLPASLTSLSAGLEMVIPTTGLLRNREVLRNYWKLAEKYGATALSAVPTVLAALADVPLEGADVSRIRYCRTGAAPLPPELAARFERQFGLHVHESLGMTETHGIVSIRPPGLRGPAGCVGLRLPHSRIRIARLDAEGAPTAEEAAPGEAGMILFKAPNVFPGYLDPAATAKAFDADGWLITGDVGYLDEAGLLHLAGRAKDLIIRSGHNIDPRVIEEALDEHPAVRISAAVGAPDAYAGELPVAYVELAPGAEASEEELLEFARAHVDEPPARPRWVEILPAMATTNVGKIFKPELRRRALERIARETLAELTAPNPAPALEVEMEGEGYVVRAAGDEALRARLANALAPLPPRIRVEPLPAAAAAG